MSSYACICNLNRQNPAVFTFSINCCTTTTCLTRVYCQAMTTEILMSIRSPEYSLKSIIHLFQAKQTDDPYADAGRGHRILYSAAGSRWPHSVRKIAGRYYYFDAELIKTDSRNLLQALTRWCELTTALSDRYRTFSLTGKAGQGILPAL